MRGRVPILGVTRQEAKHDLLERWRVARHQPRRWRRLGGDDRVIQLRGDHAARYGLVVSVLDLLAEAGLTKVALVTDRKRAAGEKAPPAQP